MSKTRHRRDPLAGSATQPAGRLAMARWPAILAATALALLVSAVFYPILDLEFVEYDVSEQVVHNPYIRALTWENLAHIFTSRCIYSYYPIRTLTYTVDYRIWGLRPAGFALTNGLFHLANVLLVFWLVVRLFRHIDSAGDAGSRRPGSDACVAAYVAGLFAVHPVVVEPVAWVCGREELLMTLGALGCAHFHLTARRLEASRASRRHAMACHAAAALSCAVACLSNAVGAVIPLLTTAWDLLIPPRPTRTRLFGGTAALWLIAAAAIAIKRFDPDTGQLVSTEASLLSTQRLMLVATAYAQNLRHLFWPVGLACEFGWTGPPSVAGTLLGIASIGLTAVLLWALRRRPLALLGLVWFVLALAPTSQIMPHHIHRADRFLYLPLVGLALAVAAHLRPLAHTNAKRKPVRDSIASVAGLLAMAGAGLLILIVLGVISWRQTQVWRNDRTLCESTLRLMPDNPIAHSFLARHLARAAKFPEAIEHYEQALRVDPRNLGALNNYALLLVTCPREEYRNYRMAVDLAQRGCRLTNWRDPDLPYTLALASTRLAVACDLAGQYEAAIGNYTTAVQAVPDFPEALFKLAFLLATCRDEKLRDPPRAVQLAERSCALAEQPDPYRLSVLAAAYASAGRFDEAVAAIAGALDLARAANDGALIAEFERQTSLYRGRFPYRDSP